MKDRRARANPEPGEKAEETAHQAKARNLASRKFDFISMVNADPQCPPTAMKVASAYIPFVKDFNIPAFRSTLDLQIDTGLYPQAIIAARRKLVELGYFTPAGKTKDGTQCFRLSFSRENRVIDHRINAREKLREMDAYRKEKQRLKRQAKRTMTMPDIITETDQVTMPNIDTNGARACDNHRPVTMTGPGDSLDEYLEESLSEEREPLKVSTASLDDIDDEEVSFLEEEEEEEFSFLDLLQDGKQVDAEFQTPHQPMSPVEDEAPDPDLPLAPASEEEVDRFFEREFAECGVPLNVLIALRGLWRDGRLTMGMIEEQRQHYWWQRTGS